MSDLIKTIKINELPEKTVIEHGDIFVIEDANNTQKISAENLIQSIQTSDEITKNFIQKTDVNAPNGVAPLDSDSKLLSTNIPFGSTAKTVFEGNRGKALEDGLDAHLLDKNNPHNVTLAQLGITASASDINSTRSDLTTLINTKVTQEVSDRNTAISNHNLSSTAHTDLRNLIAELTNRLNALADSDDDTLDQMSEIVAYIKTNKELIDNITTSKVNVSDIINNLTTNVTNKPLSAAQGVVLKSLIDALQTTLDTKASSDTLATHTGNTTAHITSTERTNWNDANSQKHTHSNKTVLDGITSALVTSWNNAVTHISDSVKHITSTERTLWNTVSDKVDKVSGKGLSTNDYTTTEKTKLSGIATGAEVNQNAFSNVVVGSTTVAADTKTDTLTFAGSNVTITPDATNDKITIGITKDNVASALGYTPSTSSHTHDDRYYTETEIDTKLSNLAISGTISTATKLATARTIQTNLGSTSAASFDGSANVTPGVTGTLPVANGGTGATTAATARTNLGLGAASTYGVATSVASGGTGLITSGAVYTALADKLSTSGTAASATKLTTDAGNAGVPIYFSGGKPVTCTYGLHADVNRYSGSLASGGWKALGGSSAGTRLTVAYNNDTAPWTSQTYSSTIVFGAQDTKGLLDCGYANPIVTFGGGSVNNSTDDAPKWYMKLAGTNGATYTLPSSSCTLVSTTGSISGNAATATTLATARTINGTSFNGSANITTANWGTARTITIGSTGKSVNGSGNVSWSLSEIGAAASSHTHSYLPLSGGTLTGNLGYKSNYLIKPVADYRTTSGAHTGAITIALPASISNTMVSMWIDVYNYSTNTSFSVHCGGYTYNNSTWANNPFATIYGANHKVRLGHNGTNFVVYIGEIDSSWSYPQISVRDVILGYSPSYSAWSGSWTINFSTAFSNVTFSDSHVAITSKNYTSYCATTSHTHNYAGSSSAGGAANLLAVQRGNEINFKGATSCTHIWFNYRNADTGANSGNTAITTYCFGNKNAGTSSVTLQADNFTGTAANANKLGNYSPSSSASNSTIALRTTDGYLFATHFNQSSSAETPTTSSYIMYANSDGYLRKSSLANIKTILGLGSAAYTASTAYAAASHTHNYAASSHTHAASNITAGTFGATGVVAATGTDYTTNRVRNTVFTTTDPGAGVSSSYANGSIICVYE